MHENQSDFIEPTEKEIQAQVAESEFNVKKGEAMARLAENEDFKFIFNEIYIDAWAITNTMNMSISDPATRARIHEKMIARGHFSHFCQSLIEDGKNASENLAAFRQAIADAQKEDSEETEES